MVLCFTENHRDIWTVVHAPSGGMFILLFALWRIKQCYHLTTPGVDIYSSHDVFKNLSMLIGYIISFFCWNDDRTKSLVTYSFARNLYVRNFAHKKNAHIGKQRRQLSKFIPSLHTLAPIGALATGNWFTCPRTFNNLFLLLYSGAIKASHSHQFFLMSNISRISRSTVIKINALFFSF